MPRPEELSVMMLMNGVCTLLSRVGGGRLAQYRHAVVVGINSDVLGLETRQLERCCGHGVELVEFVEINSRKIK